MSGDRYEFMLRGEAAADEHMSDIQRTIEALLESEDVLVVIRPVTRRERAEDE